MCLCDYLTCMSINNKSVSLILGSGGARGLAHIGVIHELERQEYCLAIFSLYKGVASARLQKGF